MRESEEERIRERWLGGGGGWESKEIYTVHVAGEEGITKEESKKRGVKLSGYEPCLSGQRPAVVEYERHSW